MAKHNSTFQLRRGLTPAYLLSSRSRRTVSVSTSFALLQRTVCKLIPPGTRSPAPLLSGARERYANLHHAVLSIRLQQSAEPLWEGQRPTKDKTLLNQGFSNLKPPALNATSHRIR